MSITIKHLEGPLKGEKSFGDDVGSILIGRDAKAEISYPEECVAVDGEHLRLNREPDGSWTIELPGSCDVEIEGKPAETGESVESGSVIRVGVDGPRFEVLLPGITIKHIEGPLAGTRQYFGEAKPEVVFARSPGRGDVTYPAGCKIVGRMHFTLKRNDRGDYSVELTPKHYVEIDGNAADNGMLVPPHAAFRLGDEAGPTFSADVAKPAIGGEITDENVYVAPVREKIARAEGEIGHVKKYGTYAFAGLAAVVCAAVVVGIVRDVRHANEVQQLAANLAAADDRLTQLAESQIDESEQKAVLAAVYLVAKVEGGKDVGKATAWAFGPDKLATNAHVTSQIDVGKDDWVLIGPNGERIPIKSVDTHPGYSKFKSYLDRIGGAVGSEFKRLDVINEYDVGIIHPAEPLPVDSAGKTATLEVASQDDLKNLVPGAPVAAVGFPIEGMTATMVVTNAPATLHFGNISSLTDVFMCRASPEHSLLIQHTVPVTGGMSGSPLVDANGKVVGVVSGGTTAKVIKEVSVTPAGGSEAAGVASNDKSKIEAEGVRIPNAAMVNFAQRIDLLDDVRQGADVAEDRVKSYRDYWDSIAEKFDTYFESVEKSFTTLVADKFNVPEATRQDVGSGTLKPRNAGRTSFDLRTHSWTLQPGHLYGFIADSKNGIPVTLNVKKQGSSTYLKDETTSSQAGAGSVPKTSSLAPATLVSVSEPTDVAIDVFSMISQPADYELYVYDWVKPADSPSADASESAAQP